MKFSKLGGLIGFLSLAEVAFAITIIAIIANELYNTGWYEVCGPLGCTTVFVEGKCLMTDNSINVCRYGYATAAIGICCGLATMFAMCLPASATLLMSVFGSIWWLAYSITATVYSDNVDDKNYPQANYREMVYALSWTTFVCCVLCLPLAWMMKKEQGSARHEPAKHKPEMGGEGYKVSMPPPPPPAAVV